MRIACLLYTSILLTLNLSAQTWEPATAPPNFLTDHSFGFSFNGKGYLVSGVEEFIGPTDKFMEYDPITDEWKTLDSFPGPARGFAIGDIWESKAYFGFGASPDSLLRDLWVFDPDSMAWTELAPCPCEARTHPTLVANNGKVYVGLGSGNSGNLTDWWEYDIATNQWNQKADFPDVKRHHPYQFSAGDYVYSGFGHGQGIFKDWYRYDPSTDIWDKMADIPGEGRVAGTQFSYNNKGYILSGDGEDHLSMEEGEFWEYNPATNSWLQLPSHPGKSRWAPASFIIDDVVYLFNGTAYFEGTGSFYQAEAYKFDLKSLNEYEDMLSIGKQWIFEDMHYSNIWFPFSDTTIETITITTDTIINFKNYKQVVLSRHPSCWNTGTVEYLRQEGQKIYRLSKAHDQEFLMIDFGEESGYQMLYDNGGVVDTGTVIIDSFGTEYAFDGTLLEVQYVRILNNQSYDDDAQYRVYKNIGFLEPGLLFPDLGTGLCDFQDRITLRCVTDGQDTIHFTEFDCFELQVISSTDPGPDSAAFILSPNPASNELNIEYTVLGISLSRWRITDALGRIIKEGKFDSDSEIQKIDIAEISSGLYVFNTGRYSTLLVIQK